MNDYLFDTKLNLHEIYFIFISYKPFFWLRGLKT